MPKDLDFSNHGDTRLWLLLWRIRVGDALWSFPRFATFEGLLGLFTAVAASLVIFFTALGPMLPAWSADVARYALYAAIGAVVTWFAARKVVARYFAWSKAAVRAWDALPHARRYELWCKHGRCGRCWRRIKPPDEPPTMRCGDQVAYGVYARCEPCDLKMRGRDSLGEVDRLTFWSPWQDSEDEPAEEDKEDEEPPDPFANVRVLPP